MNIYAIDELRMIAYYPIVHLYKNALMVSIFIPKSDNSNYIKNNADQILSDEETVELFKYINSEEEVPKDLTARLYKFDNKIILADKLTRENIQEDRIDHLSKFDFASPDNIKYYIFVGKFELRLDMERNRDYSVYRLSYNINNGEYNNFESLYPETYLNKESLSQSISTLKCLI